MRKRKEQTRRCKYSRLLVGGIKEGSEENLTASPCDKMVRNSIKKGDNAMKKFMMIFVALMLMGVMFGYSQECTPVTKVLTTSAMDGNDYAWSATLLVASPTVDMGRIQDITISRVSGETAQTISFYQGWTGTAFSTASVTKIWEVILGTGTQSETVYVKSFNERFPLVFKDGLGVKKDGGSTVILNVNYR